MVFLEIEDIYTYNDELLLKELRNRMKNVLKEQKILNLINELEKRKYIERNGDDWKIK